METNTDDLFRSHKDIWGEIKKYYYRHRAIPDISILETKFRDFDPVPIKADTAYYLEELRNDYLKQRMASAMTTSARALNDHAPSEVLAKLQADIMSLTKFTNTVRDLDVTDYDSAKSHYEQVAERAAAMGGAVGIPTGIKSIDTAYPTGMAGGHLIPIIGWPSRGKTWFAAYLAIKAWEQGFKPMFVSLEMSPEDMRNRIYGLMGSGLFRVSDFQKGSINVEKFSDWGSQKLKDRNGFILVSSDGNDDVTPMHVQAKVDQHRPDLVVCDYHQLFADNKKSSGSTESAKNVSREFKLMAVSNNIPLIDIVAATRDDTADLNSPPKLSHVAWSKAIEYDADMGISIHRSRDENNHDLPYVEASSVKNRHGEEFDFILDIDLNRGIMQEKFDI